MFRKLFVASETIIIMCDEMNIIGVSFFIAHNLFDKCHIESLCCYSGVRFSCLRSLLHMLSAHLPIISIKYIANAALFIQQEIDH